MPGRQLLMNFPVTATSHTLADYRARGGYAAYDCVVIVTDHKAFDYEDMVAGADVIVDTRNAIKKPAPNVFKLGSPRPEVRHEGIALA